MRSASAARTIRLPCANFLLAQAAVDMSATCWMASCRTVPQFRLCTHACTGQRSIDQHSNQPATRCNTHLYLHLTCCICRRIQICSGCSRGRSSFQPAYCCLGDVRAQWLHVAGMPGGRAHMPCMPLLRNEHCTRKAAKPAISLSSTLQTLYRNQTNS